MSSIERVQTAVAGILKEEDRYFIVTSNRWHGKLALPGGKIERGESAFDAIRREMKEETGLDIIASDLVYVDGPLNSSEYVDPSVTFMLSVFRCYTSEAPEIVLNEEASAYEWLTAEELKKRDVAGWTKIALEHAEDPPITRHGYLPHIVSKKILVADVDDFINPAIKEATRELLGKALDIHELRRLPRNTQYVAEKLVSQKYMDLVGPTKEAIVFMKTKTSEGYEIIMLCDINDQLQQLVKERVENEGLKENLETVVRDNSGDGWKQKVLALARDQEEIIILEDSDEDLNSLMRSLPDKRVYAFILGKRPLEDN